MHAQGTSWGLQKQPRAAAKLGGASISPPALVARPAVSTCLFVLDLFSSGLYIYILDVFDFNHGPQSHGWLHVTFEKTTCN